MKNKVRTIQPEPVDVAVFKPFSLRWYIELIELTSHLSFEEGLSYERRQDYTHILIWLIDRTVNKYDNE